MFNNLFSYDYRRTPLEAFGFYIAYFILFVLFAFLVGLALGILGFVETDKTFLVGVFLAMLLSLGLSLAIVVKKKLWGNFWFVLLIPLSGILGFVGGMLLGGIVPAYLSTR
jgi:hypothetical protein